MCSLRRTSLGNWRVHCLQGYMRTPSCSTLCSSMCRSSWLCDAQNHDVTHHYNHNRSQLHCSRYTSQVVSDHCTKIRCKQLELSCLLQVILSWKNNIHRCQSFKDSPMNCQDNKPSFFQKNSQVPKKQVSNGFYQLSVRTGC